MSKNELVATMGEQKEMKNDIICTLSIDTIEDKKKLYNAVQSPTNKIAEYIGKDITFSDFYIEFVEMTNDETGEITNAPRIVIFDENGATIQGVSWGLYNSLQKAVGLFGFPFEMPMTFEVQQIQVKKNRIYNLLAK